MARTTIDWAAEMAWELKPYLKRFRATHAPGYKDSLFDKPAFINSLRQLVEVHEYGDMDIGAMLGLTRERVRQLRNKLGIKQRMKGSRYREFDWERMCFVSRLSHTKQNRKTKRSRNALNAIKQCEEALRVQRKAQELGRVPTLTEVFDPAELAGVSTLWSRNGSYSDRWDALWRAAGFRERPDGRSP